MTTEETFKQFVLEQIQAVIDGKLEEYKGTVSLGIDKISNYLCSKEFEEDEWDSNGWQVDYWQTFTHKELGTFVLSGSLYYGKQSFSKFEEEI